MIAACLIAVAAALPSAQEWIAAPLPGSAGVDFLESVGPIVFAATDSGRIYRSEDSGASWRRTWPGTTPVAPISDFLAGDSILLAASGYTLDLALVDCPGGCANSRAAGGVLRSRDGGQTWQRVGPPAVTSLARLPAETATVLAATLTGVFLSRDFGLTWEETEFVAGPGSAWTREAAEQRAVSHMQTLGQEVYLIWAGGIHRVEPAGSALRIHPVRDEASCLVPWKSGLVACGKNAVLRWRPGNIWDTIAAFAPRGLAESGDRLVGWTISTHVQVHVAEGDGETWLPPVDAGSYGRMALSHGGALLVADGFRAVRRWDPAGQTLLSTSAGMGERPAAALALTDGAALAAYSAVPPILYHRPAGPASPWRELPWNTVHIGSRDGKTYLADGQLRVSALGGAPDSWQQAGPAEGDLVLGDGWQLVVRADNTCDLCQAGSCERLRSGLPPPVLTPFYTYLNSFSGAAVQGDTVWLALDSLHRSDDRGRTFRQVGSLPVHPINLVRSGARLLALGNPKTTRDTAWFSMPSLVVSEDGGVTWAREDVRGMRGTRTMVAIAERRGELYAATDSGVFARLPGQDSWMDIGAGLPPRPRTLAVDGNWLAAGFDGGMVMLRELPTPLSARPAGPARGAPGAAPLPPGCFADPSGIRRRADGRASPGGETRP